MKKMMTLAMMIVLTVAANAMSYTQARNEALFLSDKMAYELNLTDAQYEAVYEINLDYMMNMGGRNDLYGVWWDRRNTDLRYVLTAFQYKKYVDRSYFYRPLSWQRGAWAFNVYSHYTNRSLFYKARPKVYVSYRGGNHHGHYTGVRNSGSTWRNTTPTGRQSCDGRRIAQNNNHNRHRP